VTIQEYERWKAQVRVAENLLGAMLSNLDRAIRSAPKAEEARRALIEDCEGAAQLADGLAILTNTNEMMSLGNDLVTLRQRLAEVGNNFYRFRLFLGSLPKTRD